MADSSQYDDATLLRRRKIAEALYADAMKPRKIEHWAQGLAQMAQAGIGGLTLRGLEDQQRESEAATAQTLAGLLGGSAAPAAAPVAPQSTPTGGAPMVTPPMGNKVAAAMGPRPVEVSDLPMDGPSPLDPPSGADRDRTIRTMLAEAGNQGPQGMNAVASVIRNRAVNGEMTPSAVVQAPNQFEPWNTQAGRQKMAAIDPNSPQYAAAGQALESAYAGNDPTGGATHFYAPKAQAALGRPAPAWDNGKGVDIGDHRFFGGNPVAQAMMPQNAPQSAPSPQGDIKTRVAAMLNSPNPAERRLGMQLAQNIITQQTRQEAKDPLDVEAKKLDIEAKRKALNAPPEIKTVETDGGKSAVQWDPEKKAYVPFKAPEGSTPATPKLTEQQSKDVGFYNRGKNLLPRLEQQDLALTDALSAAGGSVSNYLKSDDYRKAEQTGKELLAVILRKDTGAAVTPSEMSEYGSIYLPRPGDDPETIQQKRVARTTAIEGLRMGLGPAEIIFKSREAAEAAKGQPPAAAQPTQPQTRPSGTTKSGVKWSVE